MPGTEPGLLGARKRVIYMKIFGAFSPTREADSSVQENRTYLRQLIENQCLLEGDFILSTGARSTFYFDCKRATLNGQCLTLIADAFLEEIDRLPVQPTAIGGLTMGADFLTAAVVLRANQIGHPTAQGSIVRKESKKHGTKTWIENELPRGTKIVVVDDVITTGNATALACEKLNEAGYEIVGIIALIDREAGGMENLDAVGVPRRAIYRKRDFPRLSQLDSPESGGRKMAAEKEISDG